MVAVDRVLRGMAKRHRLVTQAHAIAERGGQRQFVAGLQTEGERVLHLAGDPARIGDPGNRGKAHAGEAGEDGQHIGDRRQPADTRDIGVQFGRKLTHAFLPGP